MALQILALLEFSIEATPPLPNKATKSPICQQPEQTQAPTGVGRSLESLLGEAPQRATGQMGLMSARTYEGQMPIGEAHSRPPDLPDPQTQGSTAWEPAFIILKAHVHVHKVQGPVPDKGAHMRPNPWPNLGVVIIDPDTCIGSASQLEGEQNINLPSVGSELHAAPPTPQIFSLLPPDTLACENSPRGEAAAIEQHATKDSRHPEPLKPPDGDLQESGGASASGDSPFLPGDHSSPGDLNSLGPACMVADVDAKEVEPLCIDAHK